MARVAITINQGQYKKYRDEIEAAFDAATAAILLALPYFRDFDAYWFRGENFGIRLVDDPVDYRDTLKFAPTAGRFEHCWFFFDEVQSFVEEQSDQIFICFNFPTWSELQTQDGEGLVLRADREITWNQTLSQYELNGLPI